MVGLVNLDLGIQRKFVHRVFEKLKVFVEDEDASVHTAYPRENLGDISTAVDRVKVGQSRLDVEAFDEDAEPSQHLFGALVFELVSVGVTSIRVRSLLTGHDRTVNIGVDSKVAETIPHHLYQFLA